MKKDTTFNYEQAELELLLQAADTRPFRLFGKFFNNIITMGGISQTLLTKKTNELILVLVAKQVLSVEDAARLNNNQNHVSRCIAGQSVPSFNQITLWCQVLYDWHRSDALANMCNELGIPLPIFENKHVRTLKSLAGYVEFASGIKEAGEFAEWYNNMCATMRSPFGENIAPRYAYGNNNKIRSIRMTPVENLDPITEKHTIIERFTEFVECQKQQVTM